MEIHIRRREFIGTLGGAVVALPVLARAQHPKIPRLCFLAPANHTCLAGSGYRKEGNPLDRQGPWVWHLSGMRSTWVRSMCF